jgi:hypothetical protein
MSGRSMTKACFNASTIVSFSSKAFGFFRRSTTGGSEDGLAFRTVSLVLVTLFMAHSFEHFIHLG